MANGQFLTRQQPHRRRAARARKRRRSRRGRRRRRGDLVDAEAADKPEETSRFFLQPHGGERRLDVLELREICRALGTTLSAFVKQLETRLGAK